MARAASLYRATFGADPEAIASAPGRVNLIGEHVDYHGGHVLPAPIFERTAAAVGRLDGRFHAVSEHGDRFPPHVTPWPARKSGSWADYAAGSALAASEALGLAGGARVAIASDVPAGAGVSSSAALEVSVVAAVAAMHGHVPATMEVARLAHRAETTFVGVPCGMMDQTASACAPPRHAMLINCRTMSWSAVGIGLDLVLADSGERHALRAGGGYPERRREGERALALLHERWPEIESLVDIPPARLPDVIAMLPPPLSFRVRHVVNENQRAKLAALALETGDPEGFGVLVNASHASLRDLYDCSTPRMDAIVEAARALPQVLGARLVGAGWGGSVLVVCEAGAGGRVAARLRADRALALPDVRTVTVGEGMRLEPHP